MRLIRGTGLLALSFFGVWLAVNGYLEQNWTKGIFGIMVMIVSDQAFDKLYKNVKVK